MAQAVVVELSQTSAQKRCMGDESVLSRHRRKDVEVCGAHRHGPPGTAFLETAALCGENAHTTTPKDQRGSQPFRSPVALVFCTKGKGSTVRQTVADDRLSTPEGLDMALAG